MFGSRLVLSIVSVFGFLFMEPQELRQMVARFAQVSAVLSREERSDAIKLSFAIRQHLMAKLVDQVTQFPNDPIMLAIMSDGWGAMINEKVLNPCHDIRRFDS
jgi:hypothetical protein